MATMSDILRLSGLEEAQYDFSKEEVETAFALLEKALKRNQLVANLRTGEKRTAKPSEFELMGKSGTDYQFKHRESRNYVLVNEKTGGLAAPRTDKPFFKGEFPEKLSDLRVVSADMWKMLEELKRYTRRMERGFKNDEPRQIRPNANHVIATANQILSALKKEAV